MDERKFLAAAFRNGAGSMLAARRNVGPGVVEKDFVSSAACPADMEGRYGATPPSLFCRGRGGRKPYGRRGEEAAHRPALAEPPNPRSRIRGRRPADEPQRARNRTDRGRPRLSRPCTARAYSG